MRSAAVGSILQDPDIDQQWLASRGVCASGVSILPCLCDPAIDAIEDHPHAPESTHMTARTRSPTRRHDLDGPPQAPRSVAIANSNAGRAAPRGRCAPVCQDVVGFPPRSCPLRAEGSRAHATADDLCCAVQVQHHGQMTDKRSRGRFPVSESGLVTCTYVVAGAGFEPATSGL